MDDFLFEAEGPPGGAATSGSNAPEVTVSELSGRIKRTMEDAFGRVRVRGEVGRVSRPRSGHIYLDLKDEKAVLAGVVWKGVAQGLEIQPEEGLEVVAEGKITTYPGQSKYQLVIDRIAPAGVGALMAMLEERKKKLAAEGLFDAARKSAPPFLPEVVGVVTSPSGAVIRDILHRLRDRFPRHVLLWPVAVQGPNSAAEVARAIKGFDALAPGGAIPRPDVLIVARGGGSVEDLWSFNEEIVARAVDACRIPVISAVGHETDTTLIDYVADRRAPTPTAAAEMAVPVRAELMATLAGLEERRLRAGARGLEERRLRVRELARALPRAEDLLAQPRQRLDYVAERLPRALLAFVRSLDGRLGRLGARIGPSALRRRIETADERLDLVGRRLGPALARGAERASERFARGRFDERLARGAARRLEGERERLEKLGRLLRGFSYKETLARGYAAVRGPEGVVSSAAELAPGAALEIEFADGRAAVTVDAAAEGGASGGGSAPRDGKPTRRKRGGGEGDGQGRLFSA